MASMKNYPVLILCVCGALISNFVISLAAISKVRRSANDYVVTEEAFSRAVYRATTNFLSGVVSQDSDAVESERENVSVKFVEGMTIYYRHRLNKWIVRYNGCDFVDGDYFDDGLLLKISEGRAYCRNSNGEVLILRPKLAPHAPGRQLGRGGADVGEEGSHL